MPIPVSMLVNNYQSSIKKNKEKKNTAVSKGLQIHTCPKLVQSSAAPCPCLMYFDAGVSEHGLIFKRGTKVASLLKQGLLRLLPRSHFLHVTSAQQFTLSQNSTEAAQKKFKSLACVAVTDTCSPVLSISPSSSFSHF